MAEQADWDRVDLGSLRAEYGFRHTVADRAEKGESAACPHAVPRLTAQCLPTGVDGRERRARPPATAVASAPEGPGQCRTQVAVAFEVLAEDRHLAHFGMHDSFSCADQRHEHSFCRCLVETVRSSTEADVALELHRLRIQARKKPS